MSAQTTAPYRYIPTGSTRIDASESGAVAYLYETPRGLFGALGYSGKRGKPDFHYTFRTSAKRLEYLNQWRANLQAAAARKEERARERREYQHPFQVGDILVWSWGYEQTNVDWYQVTAVRGKTITMRQIESRSVEGSEGFMSDRCIPVPDTCFGTEITKRPTYGDAVSMEFGWCGKWDGKPHYRSWYA